MSHDDLSRRDFQKLSLAALGGALSGSMLAGCSDRGQEAAAPAPPNPAESDMTVAAADHLLTEPHVCRGLNTCKGHGAGGGNDCAGQGNCASVEAHSCHGENDCKGQGGCGEIAGQNDCKGQGKCGVPLSDKAWKKARADFEAAMTKAGKKVAPAPAKG